jgi:DnaK suppressor protein
MLEDRRTGVLEAMRQTMRAEREEGALEADEVRDEAEESEADVQNDLEFALLQMQSETLTQIDEALLRLDEGRYGFCLECGEAIAARRLEALPFATRCVRCEERRETEMPSRPAMVWGATVRSFDSSRS